MAHARLWFVCIFSLLIVRSASAQRPCCLPRVSVGAGAALGEAPTSNRAEHKEGDESSGEKEDEDKDKEKEKWDVDHPPAPLSGVTIDTEEGTWMNVDVSPDGKEIVFDLLGDIYTMPINGGEAKALTSGIAWDMQPRYSPDGSRIAFTSDRGGGDNIWVMNRDGSEPKAVTEEKVHLLNSPVWTPDGEYVAARKHFTSHRSIGSGEIWLYHRSGGEGLQMTKKPNFQKDVGEPAFSPDGRYLYYSQDVTPGKTFEYNKDPNKGIYAIQRFDRQRRETEKYIFGPGGAIRPTPSPDGRLIAFIRRVRYKTVLFLHEIESGRQWPLYDQLDRDMQETWAIHGVYPAMAWTPDNRSIVFWAGGKIRRIDIESQQVQTIGFHVHVTKQIAEALRFPVEVAPDRFDVKLLRWVDVSPQDDAVVYQALGHLYIRALPDGKPHRLTEQNDHFEFYPSFSRDGKQVVYTTWDDEALGTVRIVSAAGGEGRIITRHPGHYIEPVFTPDGKRVVYRKIAGRGLLAKTWSHETGVYVVPVTGGEPTLLTRKGAHPQFGADSDRVYLTRVKMEDDPEKDVHELISIDLDGSDERKDVSSKNATEYRVSPDGKWLAFTERFNAYIMPFPQTGEEIKVGPKAKSVPLAKVSRDAGQFLHFSGDSRKLYWVLGPELFTRDLKDAFDFLQGAPEKLPEPPKHGRNISFTADADVPSGSLALVGGRIITMRGDEVIEDGAIVIERNRLKVVGPRGEVNIPAGAKIIDVSDKTIMPGLIDVHDHGGHGESGILPQQNWYLYAKLAFGVTTIHDPSHDTNTIFASSELARAGLITAPRIFSTGTILYGAGGSIKAVVNSLDDARSHLRRMKAVGAFSVKSYNQPRRDQRQQIIAAARELHMMVVPEGGSLLEHNLTMIVDGHTGIEHSIPVANAYRDVIDLWAGSKTEYTPTLIVGYGGLWGENYWYQKTNVWENKRLLTFVPRDVVDPRSRRRVMVPDNEFNHLNNARICKKLVDAGVRVHIGAHGQLAGLGDQWELWMLAQGGLTPLETIRAGTLDGAEYLGLDGDIGSLEVGKLADLLVLDENPLADIHNTQTIRYTMVNGRLYDARTMNQIGNHPQKRRKFYWE